MELPRTAVAVAAPEEVGESPVALVEAAILLRCLLEAGRRSLAAEWAHGVANAGVAATGTAAIGTAIGVASAGVSATGTAAIGVAIGTVVAISMTMTTLIMRSSLAASRSGAGVGGIRTDIPATAMATHTVMATHTDTGQHTGTIIIIITAIITAAPVTEMAGTAANGTAIGVAGAGVAATGTAAIGTAIGVASSGVAATGTAAIGVASAGVAATGTGVRPKSV